MLSKDNKFAQLHDSKKRAHPREEITDNKKDKKRFAAWVIVQNQ